MNFFDRFRNDCPQAVFLYGKKFTSTEKFFLEFLEGRASLSDRVELDKPSVDQLRGLVEFTSLKPEKIFKVVVIKNADKISSSGINYLLKAVEESPSYLKWFLFSESRNVNKALLSRCYVIPVTERELTTVDENSFYSITDYASGYKWFIDNKERDDLRQALLLACDSLMLSANDFSKVKTIQKYKNLIKKEVTGFENNFKTMLVQVF